MCTSPDVNRLPIKHIEQIKFGKPLADQTLTAQVYKATIDGNPYAAKLVSASQLQLSSYHLT